MRVNKLKRDIELLNAMQHSDVCIITDFSPLVPEGFQGVFEVYKIWDYFHLYSRWRNTTVYHCTVHQYQPENLIEKLQELGVSYE